jgi:hypothetical protein
MSGSILSRTKYSETNISAINGTDRRLANTDQRAIGAQAKSNIDAQVMQTK